MIVRRAIVGCLALTSLLVVLATAPPAAAEPATTPVFPGGASATRLSGYAFDTCEAPTTDTMQAWTVSPYRGVGVYIGGSNRTCPQRNLTRSWVTAVSKMRWRVIPIYMGRQAPCTFRANAAEFTASNAASWGTMDAANAVTEAKKLGMLPGSAIYGDMEHYLATDSGCRTAVLRYLSSWTKELHRQGYLAGVYAHLYSGAKHLSEAFGSTTYARPDAIWIARWDTNTALTGWLGVSNAHWANHQRAKQYRGDHNETHGGVQINIDSDRFDAPVATVPYAYQATATVNARRGPKLANSVAKTYSAGATLQILCQTPGSAVGSTSVWNKLTDGTYVTDYYVSTPSNTTYSPPLPRCKYPYQVTLSSLNERLGPSASYVIKGSLPAGALAWVFCQAAGSRVFTTSVWDRLDDGYYVTDYYLATPSKTSYSRPIARC
jgi:archaellum component FlaF (FlaF/FlaG flagellin family)